MAIQKWNKFKRKDFNYELYLTFKVNKPTNEPVVREEIKEEASTKPENPAEEAIVDLE